LYVNVIIYKHIAVQYLVTSPGPVIAYYIALIPGERDSTLEGM